MDISPDQIEKSRRTIRAAGVFADNADAIVAYVGRLPEEHVVVAVVTSDYVFDGVHHVSRQELVERVPALEGPDGWAMVFSPGADAAHVDARTSEMIALAERRIEMLEKIAARRAAPPPASS
ncbi:MAG: hypothetical protein QOK10_3087 [Pseudonocardiales bacterium]|jgi:hypothetical protein|nr:hypothetical protein [Pseudonocardiales bacterium]